MCPEATDAFDPCPLPEEGGSGVEAEGAETGMGTGAAEGEAEAEAALMALC